MTGTKPKPQNQRSSQRTIPLLLAGKTSWFPLCGQYIYTVLSLFLSRSLLRYLPVARQIASQCEWGICGTTLCVAERGPSGSPHTRKALTPFLVLSIIASGTQPPKCYCSVACLSTVRSL